MDNILVVDDEINYTLILSAVLEEEGFETLTANNGVDALEILNLSDIDLVLTDMMMPSMDGMELLKRIKQIKPGLPVIMMTAHGSVEKAVEAMQKGAYSYILKPFENESLITYVKKALDMYHVIKENTLLRDAIKSKFSFNHIIGKSKGMQNIFDIIRKVAPTTASILIEGESGTGKELVARSIHYNSLRASKPFIPVNGSALSESLLESELFGHEKGAFTGAATMKKGRFELADGGTLFLDEIGELSQSLQVKLLRVLQEKTLERVGGTKSISVDFRLIAATNKTLKDEVTKKSFREDLYYRLNVVRIFLPPLRERGEDIPLLIKHFINKFSGSNNNTIKGINKETASLFFNYPWPGNIRELENIIERAMILCSGDIITASDLSKDFTKNFNQTLQLGDIPEGAGLYKTLALVERRILQNALARSGNIQSHAAKFLGIGKSGLNQKIKKYKLNVGSKI
ncbi:MAG: DNA-binding response regulator [Desulfobacteraceae bacterium 4572_19]|nr:MAG: DNA-binding response regulator [Desulfobacteraceae bacterium 4572_19]